VNNVPFDGKTIKASLGTTKYCSYFMRNQQCPKGDCMYLHHHGDPEASFTKEDMQVGRHQEYERKLIDEFNTQQQQQIEPTEPKGGGCKKGGGRTDLNGVVAHAPPAKT
jgi:CCR4-NOT transcription complex subunit 4